MKILQTTHYELSLSVKMLEYQIENNQQIENIFIDYTNSNLNVYSNSELFLDVNSIMEYFTCNCIENTFIVNKIYTLCQSFIEKFEKTQLLPLTYLEQEYSNYFDPSGEGQVNNDYKFSEFFRINLDYKDIPNIVEADKNNFRTYIDKSFCGYCELSFDQILKFNQPEKSLFRKSCECKKKYIETFEYDYINFKHLQNRINKLMEFLRYSFPNDNLHNNPFSQANTKFHTQYSEQESPQDNQHTFEFYPFKNLKSKQLFNRLHENYRENKKYWVSNYSYLFYKMKSEGLIVTRPVDFIEYISGIDIYIDRIDSRQSGINKRDEYYNTCKELVFDQNE